MYRLLIVDDERYIVESLCELFAAQSDPEYEILTSFYGDDALELLRRQRVDIVLLDINMPGLSGIQVAEQIVSSWPLCKIIFLTGYANFDYLYQIKQMKNTSFLLKTEDNETITGTVKAAVSEIEKERAMQQLENQSRRNEVYLQYLLHAEILVSFLKGRPLHQLWGEIRQNPANFQFSLSAPVHLLYLKVRFPAQADQDARPWADFQQQLVQLTLDFCQDLNEKYRVSLTAIDAGTVAAFLQPVSPDTVRAKIPPDVYIKECLNDRISSLSEQASRQIFLILLRDAISWSQIGKVYDLLQRYYIDTLLPQFPQYGRILTLTEGELRKPGSTADLYRPSYPADVLQELNLRLCSADKEGVGKCLGLISDYLLAQKSMHQLDAVRLYNEVSNIFLRYLTQYRLEEKAALKIGLYKLYNIGQFDSWAALMAYYRELTGIIWEITQSEDFSRKEQTLTQVRQYILDNLNRNITLNEISNYVNYNSSYLSRYFKQTTGESISQFTARTKMEYAKKYLSSTNESIQCISERLGFESSQYFSLVFKKYTGFSPRAYRSKEG